MTDFPHRRPGEGTIFGDTMSLMSDTRKLLSELCQMHGVASLYSLGSRSKEAAAWLSGKIEGFSEAPSDLDLAVHPCDPGKVDARSRVRLMMALEDLFGVSRVDLVFLPEAGAFLAADAVRGELLYCDDEDRQAEEELYYLRRAGDLVPLQRARLRAILAGELRK